MMEHLKIQKIDMNNNSWQPIETAPRDGTVILTEKGFVKLVTIPYRGYTDWEEWQLCHMNGEIYKETIFYSGINMGNNHERPIKPNPKWWMPVPPIPVDKR